MTMLYITVSVNFSIICEIISADITYGKLLCDTSQRVYSKR